MFNRSTSASSRDASQRQQRLGIGAPQHVVEYHNGVRRAFDHYHRGALEDADELATMTAPRVDGDDHHSFAQLLLLRANVAARRCGILRDDVAVSPYANAVEDLASDADLGVAREQYTELAQFVAEQFGDHDARLAPIFLNHGIALLQSAHCNDARRYLNACLSILKRCFTTDHILAADAHHNLGACMELLGDAEAAKAHYTQSLKIRAKFDDAQRTVDVALIETMTNLAMLSWTAHGDADDAMRQLQHIVPMARRLPKRPATDGALAAVLTHAGACALHLGSLERAKGYLQQALPLRVSRLGGDHPLTAQCRKLLDTTLQCLDDTQNH